MTDRRTFLHGAAAASLASLGLPAIGAPSLRDQRPLIIDALGGIDNMNLPVTRREDPTTDFGIDKRAMSDAKASGLSAFNMTIGYVFGDGDPYEKSVADVRAWNALIQRRSADLLLVRSAADIRRAQTEHRIGVILGFQNATMMGKDARRVEVFAKGGVRVIQLTYNAPNQLGDGAMAAANRGLTPFGHDVVAELNRHRIVVDLSHSGEQICLDAAAASKAPIMITHTGCRAITDLPRNKTDKELRLVADKGGFVGIYFMPFLAAGRQPTATDLIAHIEHAINVCGEDHVGIGTDGTVTQIDDMADYLKGLEDEVRQRRAAGISAPGERPDIVPFLPDLMGKDKFWKLADLLAKRGHTSGRIEKILGTNFLRVADAIWS
ncbi:MULTISPECIES: dipeptidase [unclassified Duganella]|uniref:dipeptidase n=1 Tax=unclassified Duganella TaxID=2636909 RepID=UPI0008831512|nr:MULTISPECIES: membrane dipeptidase [unclassified Duganella]SDF77012.1 membrane dipeptidase [Duganella sp. OV458]SDI52197.1 membrane dipeptidase [Duganella sp. OV510]